MNHAQIKFLGEKFKVFEKEDILDIFCVDS